MQLHSRSSPSTYATALTLQHCFAALTLLHWCCCSNTTTFMPQLSSRHIHTAVFTQLECSNIHAGALMLSCSHHSIVSQLSRRLIGATSLTQPHLCSTSQSATFFSHRIHAAALTLLQFCRCIYAAARAPQHLRCSSRPGALQVDEGHSE